MSVGYVKWMSVEDGCVRWCVRGGGCELHLGDDGVDVVHDKGDDAGKEGAIFTVSHQELEDTQEPV